MKKSKIILAIVLAVVLLIAVWNVPTFSWFSRPHEEKGEKMVLQTDNVYPGYNGGDSQDHVTFTTKASNDGGDTYSADCDSNNACNGSNIPNGNRRMFCTTITNSSGTEQNVSLYASTLSIPSDSNGSLALGVNGPTRSYRDYTSLTNQNYHTEHNYDKRIYFQNYNIAGWKGVDIYVTFGYEYGTKTYKMNWIKNDTTYGAIFYADVPYSVDQVYFTASGWQTADRTDYTMHTETATGLDNSRNSIGQSKLFRIKDETVGGQQNYRKFDVANEDINGASISEFYHDITIKKNATFNASEALEYHHNASVTYTSTNTSIFTVASNGTITGLRAGTAQLKTKVYGNAYNDSIEKVTTVTVTADDSYVFNDVPIVKNIKIPASGGTEENPANVVKVYWYIINNTASASSLSYTIDKLYISM